MTRRTLIPVLFAVAALSGAVLIAQSVSEQNEARRLYQSLSQYVYWHDGIRAAEARVARAVMEATLSAEQLESDLKDVEERLLSLTERLSRIKAGGRTRDDILPPILRRLQDDSADLAAVRHLVQTGESSEKLRHRLEKHIHPPDLLKPVLRDMADRYGFRPRMGRSRLVTA